MPDERALVESFRHDRTGTLTAARPGVVTAASASAAPGFYLVERPAGFTLHLIASPGHVHATRALIAKTLIRARVDVAVIDDVRLVVSELIANAVRACGNFVPLVIDVEVDLVGVGVSVHDPDSTRLPERPLAAMPVDEESGRGLLLLDVLAPGWQVMRTTTGKQVRCSVPCAGTHA